ncbi:hypothetical protein [Cytobacillus sp. IB215665]|uniref:hypothetical protein n=1 Tax=Cytobacillus sp. IB215665 TaxID=3097357 RepID=UPI002A1514E4|nr:hypothetical protein [Cytobacillus sp. IB215665]MDX8367770.1 hypothetical protein [Cytobacillus sp. IB215665]
MSNKGLSKELKVVTSAQISKILGFTTARIRQLESEGALVKISHGKFDLPASIQKYVEYIRLQETPEEELDKTTEETLLVKAKREKAELDLSLMKGQTHRSEDIESVMNDMVAAVRSKILALPSKLAPQLVNLEKIAVVKEKLTSEMHDALTELSEYDPEVFYGSEYVELEDDG